MKTKLVRLTSEQQDWVLDALAHRAQAAWDTEDEDVHEARLNEVRHLISIAEVTA
jgi:hypothetical protein